MSKTVIHATPVPKVEVDFDGRRFTFIYSLATMNKVSQMAKEGVLPASSEIWDRDHVLAMLEVTGYRYHPDEDWDEFIESVSPGDLTRLSIELNQMISDQNERAFGDTSGEAENTEPTSARNRRPRRA